MPRRERPAETTRSEHWMRVAVEERTNLNRCIRNAFEWRSDEYIEWVSPVKSDGYAEYYDQAFLTRLGLDTLAVPLIEFWPTSGPRWDALAKADGRKIILVEAKAYIEEAVDGGSRATPNSAAKIAASLALTKAAFGSVSAGSWERPFYQYANRLAHLHFLREINGVDAYLVFLNFADAPDVPEPCSELEWEGADGLSASALGSEITRIRPILQPSSNPSARSRDQYPHEPYSSTQQTSLPSAHAQLRKMAPRQIRGGSTEGESAECLTQRREMS